MFFSEKLMGHRRPFDINLERDPEGSGYVLHTLGPNEGVPVELPRTTPPAAEPTPAQGSTQNLPTDRKIFQRSVDAYRVKKQELTGWYGNLSDRQKRGIGMAGLGVVAIGTSYLKHIAEEKTGMHWFDSGAGIAFQVSTLAAVTTTIYEQNLRNRGWEKTANVLKSVGKARPVISAVLIGSMGESMGDGISHGWDSDGTVHESGPRPPVGPQLHPALEDHRQTYPDSPGERFGHQYQPVVEDLRLEPFDGEPAPNESVSTGSYIEPEVYEEPTYNGKHLVQDENAEWKIQKAIDATGADVEINPDQIDKLVQHGHNIWTDGEWKEYMNELGISDIEQEERIAEYKFYHFANGTPGFTPGYEESIDLAEKVGAVVPEGVDPADLSGATAPEYVAPSVPAAETGDVPAPVVQEDNQVVPYDLGDNGKLDVTPEMVSFADDYIAELSDAIQAEGIDPNTVMFDRDRLFMVLEDGMNTVNSSNGDALFDRISNAPEHQAVDMVLRTELFLDATDQSLIKTEGIVRGEGNEMSKLFTAHDQGIVHFLDKQPADYPVGHGVDGEKYESSLRRSAEMFYGIHQQEAPTGVMVDGNTFDGLQYGDRDWILGENGKRHIEEIMRAYGYDEKQYSIDMGMLKFHAQKGAFMYVNKILFPHSEVYPLYTLSNEETAGISLDVLKALKIVRVFSNS